MPQSRYFVSKSLIDLKSKCAKLGNEYVCFRYWSVMVDPEYNVPLPAITIVKNKLTKDAFAKVQASDYTEAFDSKTGKIVNRDAVDFDKFALNTSAEKLSLRWLQQKLGDDGASKIIIFVQRFARVHGILAQVTEKPLITMALSRGDWQKVRANIIQTKIVGCLTRDIVPTEDGGNKVVGYGSELSIGDYFVEDAVESANCIYLVEVDQNGKSLEKPSAKPPAKSSARPPAKSSARPPAKSSARPPAKPSARPPAKPSAK